MICRVGYALNPKKLRKSGSIDVQTAPTSTMSSESPSICAVATSTEALWRGGGLADIISDGLECEGVQFIPWNYEVPISQQVSNRTEMGFELYSYVDVSENRFSAAVHTTTLESSAHSISLVFFLTPAARIRCDIS